MFVASYRNTERGARAVLRLQQEAKMAAALSDQRRLASDKRRAEETARLEADQCERLARLEAERRESIRSAIAVRVVNARPSYGQILARACRLFRVTPAEIRGDKRSRKMVFARQFIAYWVSRRTKLSSCKIGRLMNRDHTTVLHSRVVYREKRIRAGRALKVAREPFLYGPREAKP